MANALSLKRNMPVRALIQGRPKTGKTGALVPLAEAGFKLRILDYDCNPDPLLQFTSDVGLANVDIQQLQDHMRDGADGVSPDQAKAFTQGLALMKQWKYIGDDGVEVDLGASKDWGNDTVVVVDTFDAMGRAAYIRSMKLLNKTRKNSNWRVWGFAQEDLRNTIKLMAAPQNRFHLIIFSHPKMIGPEMIDEDDDDTTKDLKTRAAAVVPTRLYPDAPGKALSPTLGAEVPIILKADVMDYHGKPRRVFTADPGMDTDMGAPVKGIKWPLPAEEALVALFRAMGVPFPNEIGGSNV